MKVAVTADGKPVDAADDAPAEALCPQCGYPVTLRSRRLMNNAGTIYYWRHKQGGDLACKERTAFMIRNNGRNQ